MNYFSDEHFREALVEAIRDALERSEAIAWPGLGTFRVEHRASAVEERPDGTVVMAPPREEIVFKADTP